MILMSLQHIDVWLCVVTCFDLYVELGRGCFKGQGTNNDSGLVSR